MIPPGRGMTLGIAGEVYSTNCRNDLAVIPLAWLQRLGRGRGVSSGGTLP